MRQMEIAQEKIEEEVIQLKNRIEGKVNTIR
jgi:hypothetical protein